MDKESNSNTLQENEKGSGKGIAEQNLRLINEKAQLFRITSNAMINVSVIMT